MASYLEQYDAIVIGAGLGGLSAGLDLQRRGFRVAIIERLSRVGGLCGTCLHDGYEFVIACNDFGLSMEARLRELGVAVSFRKPRTLVFHDGRRYTLPPDARTLARLAPRLSDLWRYFSALKQARHRSDNLESLVDGAVRNKRLRDLLKLPAYLMGVTPHQFRVEALHHEFEFRYGYWQPTTPAGGPQKMAQAMAEKFSQSGTLLLSTECTGLRTEDAYKVVDTPRGSYRARYVVNTTFNETAYPPAFSRGLPISMYWLVVDKRFPIPPGFHTLIHYPSDISDWFGDLDAGILPSRFGFHAFRSELPENKDHYTMNVYFYLPRGRDDPATLEVSATERYIFSELETMLPGIGAATRQRYFISPAEFARRHQLSARVTPVILPPGFRKPDNYDPMNDLYYAGAAVYPPGDHAGAAIRSGAEVASMICAAEQQRLTDRSIQLTPSVAALAAEVNT